MRHWIFHPIEAAKIVEDQEYQKLLKKGWYDCPDKAAKSLLKKTKAELAVEENLEIDLPLVEPEKGGLAGNSDLLEDK